MKHLLIHWVVDGPYVNPDKEEGGYINLCRIEDSTTNIAEVEVHYETYDDALEPVMHFTKNIEPLNLVCLDPDNLMKTIEDEEDET
jgi:hypothetical protein|tara:strand:+ start:6172 stop:6429 length:258 start_codon:yes stop_codon:yes gene_type:complete